MLLSVLDFTNTICINTYLLHIHTIILCSSTFKVIFANYASCYCIPYTYLQIKITRICRHTFIHQVHLDNEHLRMFVVTNMNHYNITRKFASTHTNTHIHLKCLLILTIVPLCVFRNEISLYRNALLIIVIKLNGSLLIRTALLANNNL